MRAYRTVFFWLVLGAAFATLSGCGGSQPDEAAIKKESESSSFTQRNRNAIPAAAQEQLKSRNQPGSSGK